MAQSITAAQVDGGVRKAKNGRYYVKLKKGGSRMLSDDDAKRLRAALKGSSTTKPATKPKPKPRKSKGKSKGNPKSKSTPKRTKKYLGDLL
jgi:hypothetical protein